MDKSMSEKLDILDKISKPSTNYLKEAEFRQKNQWWIKPWNHIKLKYYRILRKIGLR